MPAKDGFSLKSKGRDYLNIKSLKMKHALILRVKNLRVRLEGEEILKNLSFEIKKGEVVTILGPNGAGKTVLLKTLLGLFPYQGEVEWQKGIKLAYVPQRLPFIKNIPLSVGEFFKLKKVMLKEAEKILNLVGIKREILGQNIGKLSSGQFQRILVGWALTGKAQVLLFDEPFAGIDLSGQESIYDLLKRLQTKRDLTFLLVSHELNVVYKLTNRVLCLNKKLLCQGLPKDVLSQECLENLYRGKVKFHHHFEG